MKADELVQLALLGTERQEPAAATPGSALGDLIGQLDRCERERFVLSAAALTFQHERAGSLALRDARPLPQQCGAEKQPRANHRAGSHLLLLLSGEHDELLSEWLRLAAATHQLAPADTLPGLLALGASKVEICEAILRVLGERGRWLAAQNPSWNWPMGASADPGIWQTEEPRARLLFLQRLRRTHPTQARELVSSTWKEETPEDRATFVGAFGIGLAAEDEPFLENALDDKRKEVRRAAAGLLACLSESAYIRRMLERVSPLLHFSSGMPRSGAKLKKPKKPTLELSLPGECDKAMLRDGIESKPPAGIGEKAWWIVQMLEVVPLRTWTQSWSCSVADILKASLNGEWAKELFEAWTRAAIRQHEAQWAELLLPMALEQKRFDFVEPLVFSLTPGQRESWLALFLMTDATKTRELQGPLMLRSRHDWSAAFSRTVLRWMRGLTSRDSTDWLLRNSLKQFASCLAPETLAEAAQGWPTESKGWFFWCQGVDDLISKAQFRLEMRAALARE